MKPLSGLSVLVTRAQRDASDLAARIRAAGGEAIVMPAIEIAPPHHPELLQQAKDKAADYDWIIFTSRNAVHAMATAPGLSKPNLAAIGPATAEELTKVARKPDLVPARYTANDLVAALPDLKGARVLLPQSDLASPDIAQALIARGAVVEVVEAYRTVASGRFVPPVIKPDFVTFTSSSGVLATHERLARAGVLYYLFQPIFCIGPITAMTVEGLGYEVAATASPHTIDGLVAAMVKGARRLGYV